MIERIFKLLEEVANEYKFNPENAASPVSPPCLLYDYLFTYILTAVEEKIEKDLEIHPIIANAIARYFIYVLSDLETIRDLAISIVTERNYNVEISKEVLYTNKVNYLKDSIRSILPILKDFVKRNSL